MAAGCRAGQYWDALIRRCMQCHTECLRSHVTPRCVSYCESAKCKALPGHYYDGLLKKCLGCTEVCGSHPAECSQHCYTPPPPVTGEKLQVYVTAHVPYSRVHMGLEDSTVLLYPLLALSIVLLFSSLSLALVVFLRGARAKTSKPGAKVANHNQEFVVRHGQEVGQPGQSSKDFATDSSHSTAPEPSDDSSPTETCVCVHCFPDLKILGQCNDRPQRAPFPMYQHAVVHRPQIQTEGNLLASGKEVQEEAAVG